MANYYSQPPKDLEAPNSGEALNDERASELYDRARELLDRAGEEAVKVQRQIKELANLVSGPEMDAAVEQAAAAVASVQNTTPGAVISSGGLPSSVQDSMRLAKQKEQEQKDKLFGKEMVTLFCCGASEGGLGELSPLAFSGGQENRQREVF